MLFSYQGGSKRFESKYLMPTYLHWVQRVPMAMTVLTILTSFR
jgi:hypothetical protein